MPSLRQRLMYFVTAIWLGSFTAIGAWVVPTLFQTMDKAQAGPIAARLFSVQTSVSLLAVAALALALPQTAWRHRKSLFVVLVFAALTALLQEYAIAPQIMAKTQPALWHRLGGLAFALQWLCAAWVLWQISSRPMSPNTTN